MLFFIFLVATLNLGVGYVLGKGIAPRELVDELLARMPTRSAAKPLDTDIDDEPLSRPAPAVEAKAPPKKNPEEVLASLASLRNGLNAVSAEKKSDAASDSEAAAAEPAVSEVAAQVEQPTSEAVEAADPQEVEAPDPPENTASVDELFDRLEAVLANSESEAAHYVAAIRIDPIEGHEADGVWLEAAGREIAKAAAELLTETQTFVAGSPAMILLEGDSFDEARERLNGVRQRIEKAKLAVSGGEAKATVTCAFADARSGDPREQILEQLNLALEESTRFGFNRTYHHDGAFPTPVDEREAAETVEAGVAEAAG